MAQRGGPAGRRRRRVWIGVALAAALLLVLAIGQAWRERHRSAPSPPVAAAPPDSGPAAAPDGPEPGTPAPPARERGDLPEAVRRYLDSNVYPPGTGRLTADHLDLVQPNRRWERPRPIPDSLGERPETEFVLTADRYYYTGDETVHVVLSATRGGRPVSLRVLDATARAEGRGGLLEQSQALEFSEEGSDLAAELPLAGVFGEHHGPVVLTVRFEWSEGRHHEETLRVFTTPAARIPAVLTGEFREALRDGGLQVEVGVDVFAAGFYRFDANLFGPGGEPVAYTAFKGDLPAGRGWVPLSFFGKVLCDAQAEGPFAVRDVRGYRFLDGRYPDREPLRHTDTFAWTTAPYAAGSFSDEPYTSEHQERMVELMLEDEAAGRGLDVPGLAVKADR